MVKGLPVKWGACSHTIFLGYTISLICWKDLAAVEVDGDIKIFHATTGICTSTLSGHADTVCCLTISLDGTLLGSGSYDGTIKLWDIQTGGVVKTVCSYCTSLSISPDCIIIASGNSDGSIC